MNDCRLSGLACTALILCAATPAFAQSATSSPQPAPPAAATNHYDLAVPMFGGTSNDPYNLDSKATTVAPAPGATAPPVLPEAYSFENYLRSVHGYVSAGVATHNGHNFEGGVEMPLVPGKADLDISASTGQIGGFEMPRGKDGVLTYDTYSAGLHLHPADNVDAYIGITGGHFGVPTVVVP